MWWYSVSSWAYDRLNQMSVYLQSSVFEVGQSRDNQLLNLMIVGWVLTFVGAAIISVRARKRTKRRISDLQVVCHELELELDRERIWRKASGNNQIKVTPADLQELQRLIETTEISLATTLAKPSA